MRYEKWIMLLKFLIYIIYKIYVQMTFSWWIIEYYYEKYDAKIYYKNLSMVVIEALYYRNYIQIWCIFIFLIYRRK